MNTNINPFQAVHQFLKDQIQDTLQSLQGINVTTLENSSTVCKRVRQVIQTIERHATLEETYVFSALAEFEPGVTYAFASDHLLYQMMEQKLLGLTETILQSATLSEQRVSFISLTAHFDQYKNLVIERMNREEKTLPVLLQRYYNEKEISCMQQQLVLENDTFPIDTALLHSLEYAHVY